MMWRLVQSRSSWFTTNTRISHHRLSTSPLNTTSCFLFRDLANTFDEIENLSSQKARIQALAQAFSTIHKTNPNHLLSSMYLSTAQLAPVYEGKEMRFKEKSMQPVLANLPGNIELKDVMDEYRKAGDLGTAMKRFLPQLEFATESSALRIDEVHTQLLHLAAQEGTGAMRKKQDITNQLLHRCTTMNEMVTLIRLIAHQRLRIGMGTKSVISAMASVYFDVNHPNPNPDSTKAWIEAAQLSFAQHPNFETLLTRLARSHSTAALIEQSNPHPGVPITSMTGYPVSDIETVTRRMQDLGQGQFCCEYKYDGERIQIHIVMGDSEEKKENDHDGEATPMTVMAFSRNAERCRHVYLPSVLGHLKKALLMDRGMVQSLILEGEVVAVDSSSRECLPFQNLQNHANKSVCLYLFDVLEWNGMSLLQKSYHSRREILHQVVRSIPHHVQFVQTLDLDLSREAEESQLLQARAKIQYFLHASIIHNCEGLMVKTLNENSQYLAGSRNHRWLKLKLDYLKNRSKKVSTSGIFLPDTLDLVPIGGFWGKGRRAGGFASFLMACFDAKSESYRAIGKVGTGFNDAQLAFLTKDLLRLVMVERNDKSIEGVNGAYPELYVASFDSNKSSQVPDVFFHPEQVWEIRAAQLSRSVTFAAAKGQIDVKNGHHSGLSLRFPRFIRVRKDKNPDQATETQELVAMFEQSQPRSRSS